MEFFQQSCLIFWIWVLIQILFAFIIHQPIQRKDMLNRQENQANEEILPPSSSFLHSDPFNDQIFFDDGHKIQEIWSLKGQQFCLMEDTLPLFGGSLRSLEYFEGIEEENFQKNHFFEKQPQIKNIHLQNDKSKQLKEQIDFSGKDLIADQVFFGQGSFMAKKGKKDKKKKRVTAGKNHAKCANCLQKCCQCGGKGEECQKGPFKSIDNNEKKFNETKERAKEKYLLAFMEDSVYTGCKCAKSKCMTNYCGCFTNGLGCGKYCLCQGCKNYYGTVNQESLRG